MELYKDLVQLLTPIMGAIGLLIFQKIYESISKLNENVAVVISRLEIHDEEINKSKLIMQKHSDEVAELKLSLAKKGII